MTQEGTIRRYLAAMAAGDLENVLSCFSHQAEVISPTYGRGPVRPFYERLFADTAEVGISLHAIYQAMDHAKAARDTPRRWIAHFAYRRVKRDGAVIDTDLVDLFAFDPVSSRIVQLHIIVCAPQKHEAPETIHRDIRSGNNAARMF